MRPPVYEGAQVSATEYRSRLYQVLRPATPIIPRARTLEASPAPATPHPLTPTPRTSERPLASRR